MNFDSNSDYPDIMLNHYISAAMWTEDEDITDDAELSDEARMRAKADVAKFLDLVDRLGIDLSPYSAGMVGHDLWLTRNHHGAGFWDGDYPEQLGQQLTDTSDALGSVDLYVGDDGLLYFG